MVRVLILVNAVVAISPSIPSPPIRTCSRSIHVNVCLRNEASSKAGEQMLNRAAPAYDIARTMFAVLVIGALIAMSVWILEPFLPALIWATMIGVAMWPVLLRVHGCGESARSRCW